MWPRSNGIVTPVGDSRGPTYSSYAKSSNSSSSHYNCSGRRLLMYTVFP